MSARTMLILSRLHDFESLAIGFTEAHPQSPIDENFYLHIPPVFQRDPNLFLKLKKNTHDLKQRGYNFWTKLSDYLT